MGQFKHLREVMILIGTGIAALLIAVVPWSTIVGAQGAASAVPASGAPRPAAYPNPDPGAYPVATQVVGSGNVTVGYYPGVYVPTVVAVTALPPSIADRQPITAVTVTVDPSINTSHLDKPLSICIDYSSLDLSGLNPALIQIFSSSDGQAWRPETTVVNQAAHLACVHVNHLTTFSLAAPPVGRSVPVEYIPLSLDVAPQGW